MDPIILFDLDGTLVDSASSITQSAFETLRALDIQVDRPESLTFFIGPPLREIFRQVYGIPLERMEDAVHIFDLHYARCLTAETRVYPGILALLRDLRAHGYTLCVATSKAGRFTEDILTHFELRDFFTGVFGAVEDGSRTKKEEVIAEAIRNLPGFQPERAVMVGDRLHDIHGASFHGIRSVGVLYGFGTEAELREAGASFIVRDVPALRALLLSRELFSTQGIPARLPRRDPDLSETSRKSSSNLMKHGTPSWRKKRGSYQAFFVSAPGREKSKFLYITIWAA